MSTENLNYQNLYQGLATLEPPDASVPNTRMKDAFQVRDMVVKAIRYDMQVRDWRRARIKGLVQGNPPYRGADLINAGRGDECNVNWRIAKFFLEQAMGMVYDTLSEAETLTTVTLDPWHKEAKGLDSQAFDDWSRVVTDEFDRLQKGDTKQDYTMQMSQGQMVLFGDGPMVFSDEFDWRPEAYESKMLMVPEWAKSDTNKWEWAALIVEYSPDRLYARIADAKIAQSRGWDVGATRKSIMNAHPLTRTGVYFQNWSWHEDLLKNGTYYYADQSKIIRAAHFYFREFPEKGEELGRITECMIDLDMLSSTSTEGKVEFMFRKQRRYKDWNEVIHPMYWAHDVNGYHHSVTGLGIEMYAALEYQNRLFCRTADDAFAPKLFFKPTVASDRERMSIAQVGRYGILPAALDMVQQHVQPFLQDSIAMSREVQGLVTSNLSQFRSQSMTKQQGNPVTARQIDYEASEQAKMGKTQLSRIYEQYDWLYQEKYRRATAENMSESLRGGPAAIEFLRRCKMRGVPREALSCVGSVKATRVVGQGSAFLRQQALEFLLGLVGMLPETGRTNLVRDVVASRAGQDKVDRYVPGPVNDPMMAAQQSDAMQQVASMKVGVPPVPTPLQNPLIYAETFIQAMEGALQSVQQGADPHEAVSFVDMAMPATQQHFQRMAQDKSRVPALKQLGERAKAVQGATDQIKAKLQQGQQQQAQAQQQMQQMQAGQDPETQVGLAKVQSKHQVDMTKLALHNRLEQAKTGAKLQLDQQRTAAELGIKAHTQHVDNLLKDATTAHDIRLEHAQTVHGMHMDAAQSAHDMELDKQKAASAKKNGSSTPKK